MRAWIISVAAAWGIVASASSALGQEFGRELKRDWLFEHSGDPKRESDVAFSQPPASLPIYPGDAKGTTPPPTPLTKEGPRTPTHVYTSDGRGGLSDWITYRRPGCDGPFGGDTAVQTEIYLRAGASFPFGGDVFGDILNLGWMIQGGGKALFFDQPHLRAWFVDLSIANIHNGTSDNTFANPVTIDGTTATVRSFNRTMVGLGLGRLWYLRGDARQDNDLWRVGLDVGGRWGSGNAMFNEVQHKSDVIGGLYIGASSDLEFPMKCAPCFFQLGLRGEWGYTWSDVLGQTSDVQDFNLLVHWGVRY